MQVAGPASLVLLHVLCAGPATMAVGVSSTCF